MSFPGTKQQGGRYTPPPAKTEDGLIVAYATQTVAAEQHALYTLWRDVSRFPRWQENVVSVTPTSETLSHWIVGNPDDPEGKRIEFESEMTEDIPGRKIAWRSVTDEVVLNGFVTFEPSSSGRGTLVTLTQNMKVPGGSLGNAAAAVGKRSPRQVVIENLRHFKQLAETGEIPSVFGQPHGPRGLSGGIKEWMYGETNPTPPGTSSH